MGAVSKGVERRVLCVERQVDSKLDGFPSSSLTPFCLEFGSICTALGVLGMSASSGVRNRYVELWMVIGPQGPVRARPASRSSRHQPRVRCCNVGGYFL